MGAETVAARGERTRDQIIQVARQLFVQQGYHGTSMRQIARQAGIALGGVYNHFSSKEDVFKAVFLENHPYHQVLPALLEAQGESIEELVANASLQVEEVVHNRPDFLHLMFIEIVEFKSAHARELFTQLFPQIIELGQHITRANQGRLKAIPFPILARSFIGMFFAYYLTEAIFSGVAPAEFQQGAMKYMNEIFLYGILLDPMTAETP